MLCDTVYPSSSQMADLPLPTASSVVNTSDALPMDTTASTAAAENTSDAASPWLQQLSSVYSIGKLHRTQLYEISNYCISSNCCQNSVNTVGQVTEYTDGLE